MKLSESETFCSKKLHAVPKPLLPPLAPMVASKGNCSTLCSSGYRGNTHFIDCVFAFAANKPETHEGETFKRSVKCFYTFPRHYLIKDFLGIFSLLLEFEEQTFGWDQDLKHMTQDSW